MMSKKNEDRVSTVLNNLIEHFEGGMITDFVAMASFPAPPDGESCPPCRSWSFMNQVLVLAGGTEDARGYKQWLAVNRFVRKGERSRIFILIPYFAKCPSRENPDEKILRLTGFGATPVFAVEQTDGEELPAVTLPELPEFPLMDRAREMGIEVLPSWKMSGGHGYFMPGKNRIVLCSPEEKVFFHELSHAAHSQILKSQGGHLKRGQDVLQEVTAELSAAALCKLVGKSLTDSMSYSYKYIRQYAEQAGMNAGQACLRVLTDAEKIIRFILKTERPAMGGIGSERAVS